MNVLFLNKPSFLNSKLSWTDSILSNSFKTFLLVKFEKKCLIELIWVSPIPSILSKSLILSVSVKARKFFEDFKFFEINFAFSRPICLIPRAKINLSGDWNELLGIDFQYSPMGMR